VLYDCPEASPPSAEFQLVRRPRPAAAIELRAEYDASSGVAADDLARRLDQRFRARVGVGAKVDLVPRGELPRFAYSRGRRIACGVDARRKT
jgi:hypothetical protein